MESFLPGNVIFNLSKSIIWEETGDKQQEISETSPIVLLNTSLKVIKVAYVE